MSVQKETAKPHWFAMRAYKCESRAEELLGGENGLKHFVPKHYVVRVYHGIKSKRLVPVIPSLVFVYATHEDIVEFKRKNNFIQFITWKKSDGNLEYLIVPDQQMEDFIRVASAHEDSTLFYRPEEINIQKGTRVCIHGGQLDGVKGVFMQVKGKRNRRLVVMLEGLIAVAAEVQPNLVEVIS